MKNHFITNLLAAVMIVTVVAKVKGFEIRPLTDVGGGEASFSTRIEPGGTGPNIYEGYVSTQSAQDGGTQRFEVTWPEPGQPSSIKVSDDMGGDVMLMTVGGVYRNFGMPLLSPVNVIRIYIKQNGPFWTSTARLNGITFNGEVLPALQIDSPDLGTPVGSVTGYELVAETDDEFNDILIEAQLIWDQYGFPYMAVLGNDYQVFVEGYYLPAQANTEAIQASGQTVSQFIGFESYLDSNGPGTEDDEFVILVDDFNGLTYQFQVSTNLLVWQDSGDPVSGNGVGKLEFRYPASVERIFFRVVVNNS